MADAYIGEIRPFGFNYPPRGWMLCSGQTLPISRYAALFSIIGTTYGGDGTTTFRLPNLQGRMPMHRGSNMSLGQAGGAANVALTPAQMPKHAHAMNASTAVNHATTPASHVLGSVEQGALSIYHPADGSATLAADTVGPAGETAPHNNVQPFMCCSFAIAVEGIFPVRN